ncbi:Putative transposable element [Caligus rogercresseyi]|uniref:Transposable element n=1 Tax=Caligus rogercresseyi TaxID=217165 RepID=A0A7T8KLG5_CALRO|nr:Putative transposable element [Caligus rogercresseyi]
MASERDTRIKVRALLDARKTPTEILRLFGVARMSVYCIGKKDNIKRKRESGSKAKMDLQVIKKALEAEPLKSMRVHAKDMGIWHNDCERPLLTERIKAVHLQRCQALLNNLKSATAGRVIIFSDEKTWTVDPVRNRRNDCYLSFGEIEKSARTLTTTKHPASAMPLGFVTSNDTAAPLIWFPTGFRLKAADYIKNFPDGNVLFQQDGAPAYTALTAYNWLKKHVEFWPKDMWLPYSPVSNPLDYAFWPHVQSKACTLYHANTSMSMEYITKTCQAFRRRLEAIVIADGGYIDD